MNHNNIVQFNIWTMLEEILGPEGTISLEDIDKMPAVAYNGNSKCDVLEGPCSCGAWHDLQEKRNLTFYGQELKKELIGEIK